MRSSLLLIWLLGCGEDICIRHSDCVAGEVCSANGVCAVASDGGVSEDAPLDVSDAGPVDSTEVTGDAPLDATADANDGGQ